MPLKEFTVEVTFKQGTTVFPLRHCATASLVPNLKQKYKPIVCFINYVFIIIFQNQLISMPSQSPCVPWKASRPAKSAGNASHGIQLCTSTPSSLPIKLLFNALPQRLFPELARNPAGPSTSSPSTVSQGAHLAWAGLAREFEAILAELREAQGSLREETFRSSSV